MTMIPETMAQVHDLWLEMQKKGDKISEDQLIMQTVHDLLQSYLDAAEEGHYDSVKVINNKQMDFVSVTGKKIGEYHANGDNFIADFKNNDLKTILDLEAIANKIGNL